MVKMFGYESPKEMKNSVNDASLQHYVNPADRRKLIKILEEQGFIKDYEAKNCRRDGSIFWISLTMHAVWNGKDQILYYDGIIAQAAKRARNG